MKTIRIHGLLLGLLSTLVIISCQKSTIPDLPGSQTGNSESSVSYQPAIRLENGSLLSGGVTLTAPQQVDVDEAFNITAAISCGKVAIERGYILAQDGVTKIYKDLTCSTALLQWEEVVTFQCYTDDASWNGSFDEAGTYVFRTKHNGMDGNCDGLGGGNSAGECSFNGNQFCCFVIEAINVCETSFEGEANACGNEREAVFTFRSEDAHDYIKIQGGLTNFTGANAEVTVTDPTGMTVSQDTQGGSSNRLIKVEGGIDACETITIRIRWSSTNSGGVITGSWSVKDANGVELAPAVEGLTCAN
jgi:hypothetical protein